MNGREPGHILTDVHKTTRRSLTGLTDGANIKNVRCGIFAADTLAHTRRKQKMEHVLITGGSRGIGAAAVRRFAREGCRVSFFYEKNAEAAGQLHKETGAAAYACDVSNSAAVSELISSLPPISILINNAGVSHVGLISQITPEEWDRLFAVNVKSIYNTVRAVLPSMLAVQSGCILNVSSMWGQVGASCEAAYSATKGAVDALTKALSKELGPSGIRVNAISPGWIDTDMNRFLTADDRGVLAEETLLGRPGTAEEVADALWMLSQSSYITGQVLGVNGGMCII